MKAGPECLTDFVGGSYLRNGEFRLLRLGPEVTVMRRHAAALITVRGVKAEWQE
ncbi:hypothetical protein YDYSY3_18110 [Paenibacillus chitinolyticus]|nr:hypothetical protein YDYSY3_18110 [Paenibacillus chitinolyticus]